jgi:hypothetical protein
MPARPNYSQDYAGTGKAEVVCQPWKRVAPPSDLFSRLDWRRKDNRDDHEIPWDLPETGPFAESKAIQKCRGKFDRDHVAKGKHIPARTDAPFPKAGEKDSHSRPPLFAARQSNRHQGWHNSAKKEEETAK